MQGSPRLVTDMEDYVSGVLGSSRPRTDRENAVIGQVLGSDRPGTDLENTDSGSVLESSRPETNMEERVGGRVVRSSRSGTIWGMQSAAGLQHHPGLALMGRMHLGAGCRDLLGMPLIVRWQ